MSIRFTSSLSVLLSTPVKATWALVAVCLLAAAGCDTINTLGEDTSKPKKPDKDKKSPTSIVSAIIDQVIDKKIEFNLGGDQEIKLQDCYVKWIPASGGYPAAVQIKSYDEPASESYPSLFIQASAPGDDLDAVRGQTLDAAIYLTDGANGEVWHTAATAPAKLVITNSDDAGRVVGEITAATLVQVGTQKTLSASGSFDGRTAAN